MVKVKSIVGKRDILGYICQVGFTGMGTPEQVGDVGKKFWGLTGTFYHFPHNTDEGPHPPKSNPH